MSQEAATPEEARPTPPAQDITSDENAIRQEAQRLETDLWDALMSNSDFKAQYDEAEKLGPNVGNYLIKVRMGDSVVNVDRSDPSLGGFNTTIADKYRGAGTHVSVGTFTEEEIKKRSSRGGSLSDLPNVTPHDATEDIFVDSGKPRHPGGPQRPATYQYFGPDVSMPPKGGIAHAAEDRERNIPAVRSGIENFIQRFRSGNLTITNVPAPTPHLAPTK